MTLCGCRDVNIQGLTLLAEGEERMRELVTGKGRVVSLFFLFSVSFLVCDYRSSVLFNPSVLRPCGTLRQDRTLRHGGGREGTLSRRKGTIRILHYRDLLFCPVIILYARQIGRLMRIIPTARARLFVWPRLAVPNPLFPVRCGQDEEFRPSIG